MVKEGERGGRVWGGDLTAAMSWSESESLERMMSLGDPKIRLHSTICRSRGSWDVILKNLLV